MWITKSEYIATGIEALCYRRLPQTGDETYITRTGDARRLVKGLDREQLRQYVNVLEIRLT